MILALMGLFAGGLQDGDLDRILLRHRQKLEKARTPPERRGVDDETRAELEVFLKNHPRHPDAGRAAWLRATSWLASEDLDRGIAELNAFLKERADSPFAGDARMALAEALLRKEDWAGARSACAPLAGGDAKDGRRLHALLLTAVAWQSEGEIDRAATLLREARDGHRERPESWGALLQLAVCLHSAERNAEARRVLEEVIAGCPNPDAVDAARKHLSAYLRLGTEAPAIAGRDLAGTNVASPFGGGRVAVAYFFDSTLTTAVTEQGFLGRLRSEQKGPDLLVVGISVDRDRRDPLRFKDEFGISWPLLFDGKGYDGEAARAYDVRLLPSLWVADRKGRLRFHNLAGADLRRAVAKLLQEK
jgi:TolA-binding protein